MTPSHPAARKFAAEVLKSSTVRHAKNLAACYLEVRAELDAIQRQATKLLRRRSQQKRRRRERRERELAAGMRVAPVKVALAELRRVNRERREAA